MMGPAWLLGLGSKPSGSLHARVCVLSRQLCQKPNNVPTSARQPGEVGLFCKRKHGAIFAVPAEVVSVGWRSQELPRASMWALTWWYVVKSQSATEFLFMSPHQRDFFFLIHLQPL